MATARTDTRRQDLQRLGCTFAFEHELLGLLERAGFEAHVVPAFAGGLWDAGRLGEPFLAIATKGEALEYCATGETHALALIAVMELIGQFPPIGEGVQLELPLKVVD